MDLQIRVIESKVEIQISMFSFIEITRDFLRIKRYANIVNPIFEIDFITKKADNKRN